MYEKYVEIRDSRKLTDYRVSEDVAQRVSDKQDLFQTEIKENTGNPDNQGCIQIREVV